MVQVHRQRSRQTTLQTTTNATRDTKSTDVLAKAIVSPTRSTRKVAKGCSIIQASMSSILSSNNFHPCRTTFVQELHGDETDKWVQFCEWFEERCTYQQNLEALFFFFIDEANLQLNRSMNRHSTVYWANENPHLAVDVYSQPNTRLNVWHGNTGMPLVQYFFNIRSLLKSTDIILKYYYPIGTICP